MAYKLLFNGSSARVTIPQWTVAASQDFVIDIVFDTPPALATDGVLGDNGSTSFLAVFDNAGVQTKLNNTFLTGISITDSPNANVFTANNKFRWRIERVSNVCRVTITNLTTSTVKQDVQNISFSDGFNFTRIGDTQGLYLNNGTVYSCVLTAGTTTRNYDPSASGGTGTTLPDTNNSANNGTLVGFTSPACWIFYADSATPFTGTIGKTTLTSSAKALSLALGGVFSVEKQTLTPSTKQLSVATGFVSTANKQALSVSNKQLGVVAGVSLGVGKQALILNTKPEFIQAGAVVTNGKQNYPLATKQLAVVVGNNIPFTGTINKASYALSGKQLAVQAGWNSGLIKQSLLLQAKQESVNAGALFNINEQHLNLNTKGLSLVTGTSISYIGELNKGSLSTVGKPLSIVTGTAIPFVGNIQKTSLSLSGKALSLVNGQILDIQKRSLNLVTKQLSIGETVYPIIPVERLFTIKDGDRVFLMKQVTTVYIMKNN